MPITIDPIEDLVASLSKRINEAKHKTITKVDKKDFLSIVSDLKIVLTNFI